MTTDEILAVIIAFFVGVVVTAKVVAWLLVKAGKLLMSWISRAMI